MDIGSFNINLSMKMTEFKSYKYEEESEKVAKDVQKELEEAKDSKKPLDTLKMAKEITEGYFIEFSMEISALSKDNTKEQADVWTLADIGYIGKPIGELTQEEAKKLVSEDGFFGIKKTSERIAQFVLQGAGDDVEKLKAGREGILRGFKEAEELWGSKLPDISYDTIDKAVEMIDKKLNELGANGLDISA